MRKVLALIVCVAVVACGPSSSKNGEAPSTPPEAAAPSSAEQQARIAALPAPYNEASYDAGRRVFAQCRSCHSVDEGAGNRVGPNLHGVFGREIGVVEGFNYSAPVQEADFVWDAERLDHWLQNPQTFLPGNRMAFAGVRDATQRRDLIAYLMVETAD
jgi:cytochrome c